MSFLFDSIRRLLTAALAIVLLACAAEVALRWQSEPSGRTLTSGGGIPRLPSRATRWELPAAWFGMGRHAESGEELPLRVSSLGLRGPELPRLKSPGTLRILCIGDDATLADGLTEAEAYPGRLAVQLRPAAGTEVEVLHLGLPGGCPLTEFIHYRRLLAPLRPDIVILHVDLSDADDDRAARPLLHVDAAGEPTAVVHPSLDVAPSALARYSERFSLAAWLERRIGAQLAGDPAESSYDAFQRQLLAWSPEAADGSGPATVLQPLAQWKTLLDADGIRLVASTCPNAWQAAELLRSRPGADGGDNALLGAPAESVAAACRTWGLPCVDVTAAVLRHPEPSRLYLPGRAGLSTEGHALYAAELARALTASPTAPQTTSQDAHSR